MASNTLQNLTDKIPGALGTHASYGEQVDLDGTKIIPVAYTSFGFGAGEGGGSDEAGQSGEGSGGGGGGVSIPVGAYVSRDGEVEFEPNLIALMVVAIPLVCVTGRALARIIRALKR